MKEKRTRFAMHGSPPIFASAPPAAGEACRVVRERSADARREARLVTLPDLRGLLLALDEARVEHVVIGGVAVGLHGFIRATEDLDIVV